MLFKVARVVCYSLSLVFFAGGFYFLLYPEDLFSNIQRLGVDTSNEIVFWKTLTFAYMITISALSFIIAQNITIYWRVIPVLIIAKLSSSLTGLVFYFTGIFLGIVIFGVDFPLAIFFVALYFWILKVKG